jgi:hypothetical protein
MNRREFMTLIGGAARGARAAAGNARDRISSHRIA